METKMEITRYDKNPILTKKDVPFKVNSIFNPGAVKFGNKYLLVCRVEMPNGRSSFVNAWSENGCHFTVDKNLCLRPEDHKEFLKYVEWGIEDTRIVKIEDKYYLTYTGYSRYMPLVILAETKDFYNFKILGPISEPSNKDCALFPEKINGYYWKVDRPSAELRRDIWISRSNDLIHWGGYELLNQPVWGSWEGDKIGGSTPPIKTNEGWLMLYHGVRGFGISNIYKIGVMLLDLEKPWIVLAKCEEPILAPENIHERVGDVGNVVFTNGWIADNSEVKIYYSGADTNICMATTTLEHLISCCK
jgi:predicted GH43/DUF377 family glycosyl hydrolase